MMATETVRLEQRRYERYKVKSRSFALVRSQNIEKLGQILDVSRGGLAFRYIDGEGRPINSLDSVMFMSVGGSYLNIPFDVVSDIEIPNISTSKLKFRRCGLRFSQMTPEQENLLEYYINNHTVLPLNAEKVYYSA